MPALVVFLDASSNSKLQLVVQRTSRLRFTPGVYGLMARMHAHLRVSATYY